MALLVKNEHFHHWLVFGQATVYMFFFFQNTSANHSASCRPSNAASTLRTITHRKKYGFFQFTMARFGAE